jgi:hypothetical protein
LNNSEHPRHTLLSLIRKRAVLRVQAGPPENPFALLVIRGS